MKLEALEALQRPFPSVDGPFQREKEGGKGRWDKSPFQREGEKGRGGRWDKNSSFPTGTRTQVVRVKAEYPDQLDYRESNRQPRSWREAREHISPWCT